MSVCFKSASALLDFVSIHASCFSISETEIDNLFSKALGENTR